MIYRLLNREAKAWWYHAQLRASGDTAEARKRERASILDHTRMLRAAVLCRVTRNGWSIETAEAGQSSTVTGYGDETAAMVQACLHLGVPTIDTRTARLDAVLRLPLLGKHAYQSTGYADRDEWVALAQVAGCTRLA